MMHSKQLLYGFAICLAISAGAQIANNKTEFNASEELDQIQALLLSETDMDSVVDKVLKSSYMLKSLGTETASLQEEVKIERRSWMRSLTVGVNMFGYSVLPSTTQESSTTQLSVLSNASMTLLISPFELIGQKNRIKRARYRVARQEYATQNTRREIEILITKQFLNYQSALEAYILNENNLMISEELKHVADSNFKQGAISNAEYNQILGGVMQHRLNLLEAENAVMKLKFELELLMKS